MGRISTPVKKIWISLLISGYMLAYGLWMIDAMDTAHIADGLKGLFPWIGVALLIQLYCFFCCQKVKMIDIGIWFLLLSYLFMYGQLFVDCFELRSTLLWMPISEYNQTILFDAASFANLALNMFSLGYLTSYKNNESNALTQNEINNSRDIGKYRTGILMFFIGGVCQLITAVAVIIVTQNAGSYLAYTQAIETGLIDDMSFLLLPGIIYILTSKRLTNSRAFLLVGGMIIWFSTFMLLSGSRKNQVFGILTIVLCYMYIYEFSSIKAFKVYKKIFIFLACAVFLNMLYVIREYRMNLADVIPAFLASLTNLDFMRRLIPEVLAEAGLTFCSVASAVKCVPDIFPHEYGMPIIRSIVSILPIGWLMPDFFAKASTTTTINIYLDLPVGASLIGDLYWNWGWIGIVFAFVFGSLLAMGTIKTQEKSYEVYFSGFYILLGGVRSGVFEMMRPLFIVTVVPFLFHKMMKSRR